MSVDVICDARAAECHCALAPGHDGHHACGRDGCGGEWSGVYGDDSFVVVTLPGQSDPITDGSLFGGIDWLLGIGRGDW